MRASDSTASSDNNDIQTEKDTGNTSPCLNKKPVDPNLNSNKHGYFIPVIMVIVLGIIIIATFFDEEPSMLAANGMPQDQNNGLKSNVTDALYASADSEQKAEITTDEFTVSASTSAHDDISTAATVSGTAASSAWSKALSADNQAFYSVRQDNDAYRYAPQAPYSMIEGRLHPYNKMMQARRKVYEQAMLAHNEHMQKMLEPRFRS